MEIDLPELCVLPCVDDVSRERNAILDALDNIPEFKKECKPFGLGGFGALASPSTFHIRKVQDLRWKAYLAFYDNIFSKLKEEDGYQMEVIIDRLMVRPPYRKPTAEAWHRDEAKGAAHGDVIYGGWVNLDDTDQYFSCHPGSSTSSNNGGFRPATATEKEHARLGKKIVPVPPGHLLIFNETMVHEVMSKYRDQTSVRLFVGFRVSRVDSGPLCLHDRMIKDPPKEISKHGQDVDLATKLTTGAIIPLKSGQLPAMYPKLTWSNKSIYRELTDKSKSGKAEYLGLSLTDSLNPLWTIMRNTRIPGSGNAPAPTRVAPMYCDSLKSKGYTPPQYSATDIGILFPHTQKITSKLGTPMKSRKTLAPRLPGAVEHCCRSALRYEGYETKYPSKLHVEDLSPVLSPQLEILTVPDSPYPSPTSPIYLQ
jgi:hypothetical protein